MNKKIEKLIWILWWIWEKDREDFLKVLFTEKEVSDFSDRIDILKMLKNWDTQRKISKKVWVSVTTVTRWNKFYKENKEIIEKYIK
jgi:Trp operon repressor